MAIKPDPFLNNLILAFANSGKAEETIRKTAGEVRFIKENANEMGLWAYGGSAPTNRDLTPKFNFQVRNLKPLVECLKYATASLSYAMVAYDIFTKIPSSSISPDGRLGGKGYIMKIQDIRKNFMNIVEALSAMGDTMYDEIQAPHWAAQTREMDPELKEELNIALEETEKIRTDPENWAYAQFDELTAQPAISQSTDGEQDNLEKIPLVQGLPRPEIVDPRIKSQTPPDKAKKQLGQPVKSKAPVVESAKDPESITEEESEWVGDMGGDISQQDDFDSLISDVKKTTSKQNQKPEKTPPAKQPPPDKKPSTPSAKPTAKPVSKPVSKPTAPPPAVEEDAEDDSWLNDEAPTPPSSKQSPSPPKKEQKPVSPKSPPPAEASEDDDWLDDSAPPAKQPSKPSKPPAKKGPPPPSASTFDDWMDNAAVEDTSAPKGGKQEAEEDDWLTEETPQMKNKKNVEFNEDETGFEESQEGDDLNEDNWLESSSSESPEMTDDNEGDWLAPVVQGNNSPSPVQKTASERGLTNQDWKKYMTRKF